MCTPEDRAKRYRANALECLALSDLALTTDIRAQYKHLAECYENLARAEERLAADSARLDAA